MQNRNPKLKVGDKGILIKSDTGLKSYEGKSFTVISENDSHYYIKLDGRNGSYTIAKSCDEWSLADRKTQAKYLIRKCKELKKETKECEKEIARLQEFESDEDEVAAKLEKILRNPSRDAIKQVLKELKKSDFL